MSSVEVFYHTSPLPLFHWSSNLCVMCNMHLCALHIRTYVGIAWEDVPNLYILRITVHYSGGSSWYRCNTIIHTLHT